MNTPANTTEQSLAAQQWAESGVGYQTLSDAELLELYSYSRSKAALGEIVRRHSPLVASVIRRLISNSQDAEDAFQATFLVLVLSANKIRNPDSLNAWLYGVAYRTAKRMRSMRRKNSLKVALQSTLAIDFDASPSQVEEPLAIIARELHLEAMDEELSRLPKHLRDTLVEHYLEGNTAAEIAKRLNLSVTAVEGRLKRGRKALRTHLAMRGVSLTIVAAACVRFQQDVVSASAEPWGSRFIELVGNVGVGHPSLPRLQNETTVSGQLIQLVQGELVMKPFSRSFVGLAGGLLVLGALGTIGFVSALANSLSSPFSSKNGQQIMLTPGFAQVDEPEAFVLAQGKGNSKSGDETIVGGQGAKETVIKWEKPTGPTPAWLETKNVTKESEDAIRATLNRRVDIDLNHTPLSAAMGMIAKQVSVQLILDEKALEAENITPD
jgi:RNA polymerase sigma factor (sigma-70 family)